MSARDNYYLLLDLDPSVDDWPTIDKAISAKQSQWSMDASSGSPAKQLRAGKALSRLDDIREVMQDAARRRAEADEARGRLAKEKDDARETLRKLLNLRLASGAELEEKELDRFAKRIQDKLDRDEVADVARDLGFTIQKGKRRGSARRPAGIQGLEKSKARQIREKLDFLGLPTLYQFLGPGYSATTSCDVLCQAADGIYLEMHRKGNKTSEVTARQDLAGQCKDVFKDDASKEAYNETLALEAMSSDTMEQLIATAGDDKVVTAEEMAGLLKEAADAGVPVDKARAYIEGVAAKRKWQFVGKELQELAVDRLLECGYCGRIARSPNDRYCWGDDCGKPLVRKCPKCGTDAPTQDPTCTRCGCPIGNAPLVEQRVQSGDRKLADGDPEGARRLYQEALAIWPGWDAAEQGLRRADAALRAHRDEIRALKELVTERNLEAARGRMAGRW